MSRQMEMSDIPWDRIVHFHGRATDVPAAIRDLATDRHHEAEEMLGRNLEHQDGIIQATPLAVYFIAAAVREGRVHDRGAVEEFLRRILAAAEFQLESRRAREAKPTLESVFAPQKLWPEFQSDDEDEALSEEWSPEDDDWADWAVLTQNAIEKLDLEGAGTKRSPYQAPPAPAARAKRWWHFW